MELLMVAELMMEVLRALYSLPDFLCSNFFQDLVDTLMAFKYVESFSDFLLWIDLMPTAIKWLMFAGMFGLCALAYAFLRATLPYVH